jgi:hypothetical protein
MNSSLLVLLGAFDALIALIQSERETFGKSFDPEAAVQTLQKVKSEFVHHVLAATRAQLHASDTFRSTIDQLLACLPQGCDLQPIVQALQLTVMTFLPQGPNPPWPSSSSSSSPLGFDLHRDVTHLIDRLQTIAAPKPPA